MKFLFDTADEGLITNAWNHLSKFTTSNSVQGITTNPNALSKVHCDSLADLEVLIPNLCELVTAIREGNVGGSVHVQIPQSLMLWEDIEKWISYVTAFSDGKTNVAIKIPHFPYALEYANRHPDIIWNVTGIADWATIVKACSVETVSYASLIPGRMEEAGINANTHMELLLGLSYLRKAEIITGSMRTMNGLKNAVLYGTLPTIGQRVWDEVERDFRWKEMVSYWDDLPCPIELSAEDIHYGIPVTQASIDLSKQFFKQMDELGLPLYKEFVQRYE